MRKSIWFRFFRYINMSMSGTTAIDSLPTDPSVTSGEPVQSNINMEISEKPSQVSFSEDTKINDGKMPGIMQQKTINNLVSGIQQAAAAGVTELPSRDIPMSQNRVHMDNQADPNFIPSQQKVDYIQNQSTEEQYMAQVHKNINKKDNLDILYDELQVPILISLLFFLFNLPFFKKLLSENVTFLFKKDGNYNLYGFLFSSVLFGIFYYILKTVLNHFSTF